MPLAPTRRTDSLPVELVGDSTDARDTRALDALDDALIRGKVRQQEAVLPSQIFAAILLSVQS